MQTKLATSMKERFNTANRSGGEQASPGEQMSHPEQESTIPKNFQCRRANATSNSGRLRPCPAQESNSLVQWRRATALSSTGEQQAHPGSKALSP
eukprot:113450-Pelagomonas_calceolata.AAC.1